MQIIWTNIALQSFRELILFFHNEDAKLASKISHSILSKIDLLSDNPFIGAKYFMRNVRKLKVNKYPFSIYYRVNASKIEILRIRHDARKPIAEFH